MKGFLIKYRKGQEAMSITRLGFIAIMLVFAAVALSMGSLILEKIQGTQTDSSTTILNNQTFNWDTSLNNNTFQGFTQNRVNTGSVVVYCNNTLMVSGSNYSVAAGGVTIFNNTGPGSIDGCVFNMTYNYNFGSDAYNSSNYGLSGMVTTAEMIPTVAIVAVAAIVIGVLLVFFGRRKAGEV